MIGSPGTRFIYSGLQQYTKTQRTLKHAEQVNQSASVSTTNGASTSTAAGLHQPLDVEALALTIVKALSLSRAETKLVFAQPKLDYSKIFLPDRDDQEDAWVFLDRWADYVTQQRITDDTMMFGINAQVDLAFQGFDLVKEQWKRLKSDQKPQTFSAFLDWYRRAANVRIEDAISKLMLWFVNTTVSIGGLERYLVELENKLAQLQTMADIDLFSVTGRADLVLSILLTKLPQNGVNKYRFRTEEAIIEIKKKRGNDYVVRFSDLREFLKNLSNEDSRNDEQRRNNSRRPSQHGQHMGGYQSGSRRSNDESNVMPAISESKNEATHHALAIQPSTHDRPGKAEESRKPIKAQGQRPTFDPKDPRRRNEAYVQGGEDLPLFPRYLLSVTCNHCNLKGHKQQWCPSNPNRRPFNLKEAGAEAADCQAFHATTVGLTEGADEMTPAEGLGLLKTLSKGVRTTQRTIALVATGDDGVPPWYDSEVLGVKRLRPEFMHVMKDSGCTYCTVSATSLLHKIEQEGLVAEFLKWHKPQGVNMGNGQAMINLAVRFVLKAPVFDDAGKPKGYLPLPVVANVQPNLPCDFLFGQAMTLKYDMAPDDSNGKLWLTDPRDDSKVYIQCVFTHALALVWPWIHYTKNDKEKFDLDWLGAGNLAHSDGGTVDAWQRVPWSDEAKKVRYDSTRGPPSLAGSYPPMEGQSRRSHPFTYRAREWGYSHSPGRALSPQQWRARHKNPVATSNKFAVLSDESTGSVLGNW